MSKTSGASPAIRIAKQTVLLILFFLGLYLVLKALGVEEIAKPESWAKAASPQTALLSAGLLAGDVLLPVPSSLVMTANGALFGSFHGSLLSIIGSFAASCIAYALGRLGLAERFFPAESNARLEGAIDVWGAAAIVLVKPLPILAESFAVMAGARKMNLPIFLVASLVGSIPISIIYGQIGAGARGEFSLATLAVFYLLVSGGAFGLSKVLQKTKTSSVT